MCGTRPFAVSSKDRIVGGTMAIMGDWGLIFEIFLIVFFEHFFVKI